MVTTPITNLNMIKGDDYSAVITIYKNNVIEDITGYTITFTLKNKVTDPDSIAVYQQVITTHTDPSAGKTTLLIPSDTTRTFSNKTYVYDVQMVDTDDNVKTIMRGDFKVNWDVTTTV
jgi:hypothetical protein